MKSSFGETQSLAFGARRDEWPTHRRLGKCSGYGFATLICVVAYTSACSSTPKPNGCDATATTTGSPECTSTTAASASDPPATQTSAETTTTMVTTSTPATSTGPTVPPDETAPSNSSTEISSTEMVGSSDPDADDTNGNTTSVAQSTAPGEPALILSSPL